MVALSLRDITTDGPRPGTEEGMLKLFRGSKLHDWPGRIATGAYILHNGLSKRKADSDTAAGLHGMASGSFPMVADMPPEQFVQRLSKLEIAVGGLLLAPIVPSALAGAALAGFSGGLVTMYLRTPSLHQPGSYWPTQAGTAVSKDVWMLGIGTGLVLDALTRRRRRRS